MGSPRILRSIDVHFVLRQPPNCPPFRSPSQETAVVRVCFLGRLPEIKIPISNMRHLPIIRIWNKKIK